MDKKHTCLFDMDGTLTPVREKISKEVISSLEKLNKIFNIGIVTGSGMEYVAEQCNELIKKDLNIVLYPCNGTQVYHKEKNSWVLKKSVNMRKKIGNESFKQLTQFLLKTQKTIISDYPGMPVSGTYIQYRDSMINWCMPGRNSKKEERERFLELDNKFKIREKLKRNLENCDYPFKNKLNFAIGGATSIDIYPKGWDKTYCLKNYKELKNVYFVGDACEKGRNDYEIFEKLKPNSFHVKNPAETIEIISHLLEKMN